MTRTDRRTLVRQLRDEGLSQRAIAKRLKVSKDTVRRDLEAPDPRRTEEDAPPDAPDDSSAPQVSGGDTPQDAPVDAPPPGLARRVAQPLDDADVSQGPAVRQDLGVPAQTGGPDEDAPGRRLVIDLARHPGLAEDLALLETTGATTAEVIDYAVDRLAATVRNARARGLLAEGQRFEVINMRLRALPFARGGEG